LVNGVANPGDEIFIADPLGGFKASAATFQGGIFSWQPNPAVPNVGQGFFYYTPYAAGVNWVRTFNISN
jgi:hypothetical protein